jgi:AraC-like DNA-binding protein
MDLTAGYREWAPPAALRSAVSCLWSSVVPARWARSELVLPDGCTDLIWRRGGEAFVAGPDTGPVLTPLPAGSVLLGVRLRPGAGGPAFGIPLTELRDLRVDLADVLPGIAGLLPGDLAPDCALARLVAVAAELTAEGPRDELVGQATRLLAGTRVRADQVAGELGVSARQLRRRCDDAVGYGPKTLQRILRFRRFVSRVDGVGGRLDLATVAAETGYADQAHLTRESVRLAGLPPAALVRERRTMPVDVT